MAVTPGDVRTIAALARLAVPEGRVDALVGELNGILRHMDTLAGVPAGPDAEPAQLIAGMPLAPDRGPSVPLERAPSAFAPAWRDGFFLVPRLATHASGAGTTDVAGDDDA